MASQWLDIMIGEIASRRDAVEERELRRNGIQSCVREQFKRVVKPALISLRDEARTQGIELALEQDEHGERDAMVLRLIARAEGGHPLRPFIEFAGEPYHPVVIARLRKPGHSHARRLGLFTLNELDRETVVRCLDPFAKLLQLPEPY